MATTKASSMNLQTPQSTPSSSGSADPTNLSPDQDSTFSLAAFQRNKDSAALVAFVKEGFEKSKSARQKKQQQWWQNMSMFFGNQYARPLRTQTDIAGLSGKLQTGRGNPSNAYRKTINKVRSFHRAEMTKFLSSIPDAVSVPSTAEDQDVRAAYAGEQVWQSISDTAKLRSHYTRSVWWMIVTGNGFLKTWWDTSVTDPTDPAVQGDIKFGSITPFHLFVPDLREQEIEDQPFIIIAYQKTVQWCKQFYGDALKGADLKASQTSENSILEEGYLNLATTGKTTDSLTVYEAWIKPGATNLMPEGGVVVIVDNTIVSMTQSGLPYKHGQYPVTKFEHIPTSTFYADSPIVDLISLQREYNELRSNIAYAGKVSAVPQLLAQKGSIVSSKLTNEAGLVVEYKVGTQPPQPMQLSPLPQYFIDQQDRIQADWEDLSGQHAVSRGQAPAGVTAGTAINYLQEKDNDFLTTQYQSIEDGYGKLATQTLVLFNQYVDLDRRIKYVGSDGAFDTVMLAGADIMNGTDIRIQRGSSIGQSKAANEAKVMDMFQVGLIDQPTALKLLEVGGTQKVLDVMNVAERKAQRENIRMKLLTDQIIQQNQDQWLQSIGIPPGIDPQQPGIAEQLVQAGIDPNVLAKGPPLVVPVDDFDVHDVHIDTHDKFRMGQEYENLSDAVKQQFTLHVQAHLEALMGSQMSAMGAAAGGAPVTPDNSQTPAANNPPDSGAPPASLAANGAAPDTSPDTGGQ